MPSASNYYPEMDDEASPATDQSGPPADNAGESEDSDQTALVPLSFFGNEKPEPGDICPVKVDHVYEKEASISYVKEGEHGPGPGRGYGRMRRRGRPREGMAGAMDRLDMMAEE